MMKHYKKGSNGSFPPLPNQKEEKPVLDRRHVCHCFLCEEKIVYPVCLKCEQELDEFEQKWLKLREKEERRQKRTRWLKHLVLAFKKGK